MLKRYFIIVLLMLFSVTVFAQYDNPRKTHRERTVDSRDGRYEVAIVVPYQLGADDSGENGESLDVNSAVGFGVSFGWNWTEKLNLSYRFMLTKPKYTATIIPDDLINQPVIVNYKMSKMSHQFNAAYNFLEREFTPFIAAGIGWTKLDSNIPNGLPSTTCWWDPWYGYICASDWNTYETSKFTYNLGIGLRWDFSDFLYTKAAYSREFLKVDQGSLDFDYMTFELGLLF